MSEEKQKEASAPVDSSPATGGVALTETDLPQIGDRALIVGHTGSGKTEFAKWLLARLKNSPVIIYDTKGERKLELLPRSIVVHSAEALDAQIANPAVDYIIFKIPPHLVADDGALDNLLWTHFERYKGCDVYIDELFSFSQNGRAGPGLVALLTQGRSWDITTIMAAQRPKWISRFAITETQHFYIFPLVDKKDRAALGDVIPDFIDYGNPPKYQFWYYRTGEAAARLSARVLLDKEKLHAYKPDIDPDADPDTPDAGTALNWL